jgi:hypothetical protein
MPPSSKMPASENLLEFDRHDLNALQRAEQFQQVLYSLPQ